MASVEETKVKQNGGLAGSVGSNSSPFNRQLTKYTTRKFSGKNHEFNLDCYKIKWFNFNLLPGRFDYRITTND